MASTTTINEVIVPTVIMASEEFDLDNISVQNLHSIINTARELIVEIGNRFNKIQRPPRLRVVAIMRAGRSAQPRTADPRADGA